MRNNAKVRHSRNLHKHCVFRFYAFWCVVMRREVIPILSLVRLPIPPLQPNYSQAGSNLDRVARLILDAQCAW